MPPRPPSNAIIRGKKLGQGGFGTVYECQYQGRIWALKVATNGADMTHEAVMHGKANPRNHSPNIVAVSLATNEYMIMELCDGDLFKEIESGYYKGNERRIKRDYLQILSGVSQMHARGVFHRDMKPENILVKNGVLKVSDFGSSSDRSSAADAMSTISYGPPGMLMHPQPAPQCPTASAILRPYLELFTGNGISEMFDIWALGIILLEMVFDARPWKKATDHTCQMVRSNPRVLLSIFPSMSDELYSLMKHIFYSRDIRVDGMIHAVDRLRYFYAPRRQSHYRRGVPNIQPVPITRAGPEEMMCNGGHACPPKVKVSGPPKLVLGGNNGQAPVIVNAPVGYPQAGSSGTKGA